MFRIHMLPAEHGDCLWVEYGDSDRPKRILIDAGTPGTYPRALKPKIERVVEAEGQCRFELFVITHIDADHIGGSIEFLQDSFRGNNGVAIEEVWFNGYCHLDNKGPEFLGAVQAEKLTPLVQDGPWEWNKRFGNLAAMTPDEGKLPSFTVGGMRIALLSPTLDKLQKLKPKWEKEVERAGLVPGKAYTLEEVLPEGFLGGKVEDWAATPFKEDKAEPNGSSIAFVTEYDGKRVLFGADAHPSVLIESLKRATGNPDVLDLTALKLPHHASKNNVSAELIAAFPAAHYLISTNGKQFRHPDKAAVARILTGRQQAAKTLHFNCPSEFNEEWKSASHKTNWKYRAKYGTLEDGLVVEL
jgi:beta-lactamase superfamily II metal-dependent hydrolase